MQSVLIKYKSNYGSTKVEGMYIELDVKNFNKYSEILKKEIEENKSMEYFYTDYSCINYDDNFDEIMNDYEIINITTEEYICFENKGLKEIGFTGPVKYIENF